MKYFVSIILISLFFSCATDVCNQRTAWPAQAGFYKISSLGKDSVVTADSLSLWGLNNDSLIYTNLNKKTIEFPLAIANSSSTFVFKIKSKYDTITVYHTNTPYLISKQCGYGYQQEIDSVVYTQHLFTKITWKVPQADKNDKENIQIYY